MNKAVFKRLFPFSNISDAELQSILNELSYRITTFEKNEIVLSCDHYDCELGFLLSGKCEVRRKRLKENILLQNLSQYDSFGILTLFSNEDYPTVISAKCKTQILFIQKERFLECLKRHPEVSMNVMTFLADRIQFLNKKIATLSGTTVEEKVRQYILFQYNEFGERFSFNASRVADLLNIGRASLYRAIDSLQEEGLLELDDKIIYITHPDVLKG